MFTYIFCSPWQQ